MYFLKLSSIHHYLYISDSLRWEWVLCNQINVEASGPCGTATAQQYHVYWCETVRGWREIVNKQHSSGIINNMIK